MTSNFLIMTWFSVMRFPKISWRSLLYLQSIQDEVRTEIQIHYRQSGTEHGELYQWFSNSPVEHYLWIRYTCWQNQCPEQHDYQLYTEPVKLNCKGFFISLFIQWTLEKSRISKRFNFATKKEIFSFKNQQTM